MIICTKKSGIACTSRLSFLTER